MHAEVGGDTARTSERSALSDLRVGNAAGGVDTVPVGNIGARRVQAAGGLALAGTATCPPGVDRGRRLRLISEKTRQDWVVRITTPQHIGEGNLLRDERKRVDVVDRAAWRRRTVVSGPMEEHRVKQEKRPCRRLDRLLNFGGERIGWELLDPMRSRQHDGRAVLPREWIDAEQRADRKRS